MPDYAFSNVASPKQVTSRFYHMSEAPSIGSIITDADGSRWKRIAVNPQASFDTRLDPHSAADFVRATNKPDTIGSLWDRSKEMSLKRGDKEGGRDDVKQQYYDTYAKKRKGKRHPQEIREAGTRHLKSKGVSIEWGED